MADVTIKLTGEQYRTLCMELDEHRAHLIKDPLLTSKLISTADGRAASKRVGRLDDVRDKVQR